MVSQTQADLFAAELGPGSITDNEYARLIAKTGQPFGRYSMMDLYQMADEIPRWPLGKYSSVIPPVPSSISYVTALHDATNALTYTFTNADLGSADASKVVIVVIHASKGVASFAFPTAVTIAGVTASADVVQNANDGTVVAIYSAAVAAALGNIVITFGTTMTRCSLGIYAINNAPPVITSNSTGQSDQVLDTSLNATLATNIGDFIVAGVVVNNASTTTWTGVAENYDIDNEGTVSGAHGVATSASSNISADITIAATAKVLAVASYKAT